MRVSFEKPRLFSELEGTFKAKIRQRITKKLIIGLEAFHDSLRNTPVFTGTTLVNFQWSIGSPSSGIVSPVERPVITGRTSRMKIGTEPRRSANQAVMEASFNEMISKLKLLTTLETTIYLVNNSEYFELVEYGSYSIVTGTPARTPASGMTRLGEFRFREIMGRSLKRVS